MKTQINCYQSEHTGAWIVEYRGVDDRMWTRVYVGGDRAEARQIEKGLRS